MPFKNKNQKKGRKPERDGYSTLDDDAKRKYHYKALKVNRGEDPSELHKSPSELDKSPTTSTLPLTPPKKSPGRPPVTGATAMTPTSLRSRKKYTMKQLRKGRRRRLIGQCSQNTGNESTSDHSDPELATINESTWDNSDPEMITDNDVDITVGGATPDPNSSVQAFKKALYRKKCRLRGILSPDNFDNMRLMIIYQNENCLHPGLSDIEKIDLTAYTQKYFWHRKHRLNNLLSSTNDKLKVELIKYWLDTILNSPAVIGLFQHYGVNIPDELLPQTVVASRIASEVAKKFLTPSSKGNHEVRRNSIKYIINVAKEAKLTERDGRILSAAVNCSEKFARKVLKEIANNSENNLFKLEKTRFDSIHVTEWPSKIAEFVFRPENSRAVPGEESISIRYGVRKQKHILRRSREEIAKDFKKEYPQCEFGTSVIKREFPPNAVTGTTRDNERNTCPTHANTRRIVKSINKILRKNRLSPLPHSCRELCSQVMCNSPTVSVFEPVTWQEDCALNRCKSCPKFTFVIPREIKQKEIRFSLWESRKVLVTKRDKENNIISSNKRVFSLYPFTETMENAIKRLTGMLPNLKRHIATSHQQWKAHDTLRNNMDLSTVITIEDYQMNLEVQYGEAPTSCAYSSNKKTIALYPLCVEYLDDDGLLCKGGIVFLSEDKIHDHQQIEAFEKRAFEIFRERIRECIEHWKRFSDGCGAQFWSRFVAAAMVKMRTILRLKSISYDRFEANEGKSISDTLGSITKCAFSRGVIKEDEGLASLSAVIDLIKSEMKQSTKKFNFLVIEEFGYTIRETNRVAEKVPEISKLHSFRLHNDKLISKVWTCTECTVQNLCAGCERGDDATLMTMESNDDEDVEFETFYDDDDDGQTDQSSSDESSESDSDEDPIHPGDIVWGLLGRIWYPAKICTLAEVPDNLRKRFQNTSSKYIAWWYGDELYSLVSKVEKLGETQLDGKRAARSSEMQKLYNAALADLST